MRSRASLLTAIVVVVAAAWPAAARAGTPTYGWTRAMGGAGRDSAFALAVDAQGNVVVAGTFSGTVDFDPTSGHDYHSSNGGRDICVTKLGADGSYAWTRTMGGGFADDAQGVAVDAAGNVYLAGWFNGTVDFDPGAATDYHTASGTGATSGDLFVTKLAADGSYLWTRTTGGNMRDYAADICVDSSGHVFITGFFQDTADLDPTPGTDYRTARGWKEVFVTKLNPDGSYGWTRTFDGDTEDESGGICIDAAGNVFVTGFFRGTADFDPSPASDYHTSHGGRDIFVTKLNPDGSYGWTCTMGGSADEDGKEICVDSDGNPLVVGWLLGTGDMDPTAGTDMHSTNGWFDVFVTKLHADGTYGWTRTMGGTSEDAAYAICVDSHGDAFVAGLFQGTADFDPSAGTDEHTSNGERDIFVTKLSAEGSYAWTWSPGGAGSDSGYGIAIDCYGNLFVGGKFKATVNFHPTGGTDVHTSNGADDVFVTKLTGAGEAKVSMEWVTVGDASNEPDTEVMVDGTTGYGGVVYVYRIGKYEVTNNQYAAFLNSVAAISDPKHLYNPSHRGLSRSGGPGAWSYSVGPGWGPHPANFVSFYDALRFANWMHNGQPVGPQGPATTEDGAYDMSLGAGVTRKPGARVFLPNEHEWYKAAFYKGGSTNAGYWDYATQSDTMPTPERPPGTDMVNGSVNNRFGPVYVVGPPYYSSPVGAYTAKPSTSAYGTFDQNGNAWEWNESILLDGVRRGVRGASWSDGVGGMPAPIRGGSEPNYECRDKGFRVGSAPANQAPSVHTGEDATINEGDTFSRNGSFTDDGPAPWTATVDYGDGDGEEPLALGPGKTFTLNHAYEDNGTYTVTVKVKDGGDMEGSDSLTVTVNNVAPTAEITAIIPPVPDFILPGDVIQFQGDYSDPGTADTHTFEWDFGDASAKATTQNAQHAYSAPGTYTVTFTVQDDDGDAGEDSATVVVLNPTEGIDKLIDTLSDTGAPSGTKDSLGSVLDNAADSLDKGNEKPAINQIGAFINHVRAAEKAGKLTKEEADLLVGRAESIMEGIESAPPSPPPGTAVTIEVDLDTVHQKRIDGFGGSFAFFGAAADEDVMEKVVGELGTTIVRFRGDAFYAIADSDPMKDIKQWQRQLVVDRLKGAKDRHVDKFLMTMWAPQDHMVDDGGHLDRDYYPAYAQLIVGTIRECETLAEVHVTHLGVQNEPDHYEKPDPDTPSLYRTCRFSEDELRDFTRNHLRPALARSGLEVKIVVPETMHAAAALGYLAEFKREELPILGYHLYDPSVAVGSIGELDLTDLPRAAKRLGKRPSWQTETSGCWEICIDRHEEALFAAEIVHKSMTEANSAAFLWWGLTWDADADPDDRYRPAAKGLVHVNHQTGALVRVTRKYYAIKHFSKYIAVGSRRVSANSSEHRLLVSAYEAADEQRLVLVVVNPTTEGYTARVRGTCAYSPHRMAVTAPGLEPGCQERPMIWDGQVQPKSILTLIYKR